MAIHMHQQLSSPNAFSEFSSEVYHVIKQFSYFCCYRCCFMLIWFDLPWLLEEKSNQEKLIRQIRSKNSKVVKECKNLLATVCSRHPVFAIVSVLTCCVILLGSKLVTARNNHLEHQTDWVLITLLLIASHP